MQNYLRKIGVISATDKIGPELPAFPSGYKSIDSSDLLKDVNDTITLNTNDIKYPLDNNVTISNVYFI